MDLKGALLAFLRGGKDSIWCMGPAFYLNKNAYRSTPRVSPQRYTTKDGKETLHTTALKNLQKKEEHKIYKKIIHCAILNGGIFLFSLILFDYGILPGLKFLFTFIFGETSFMGRLMWSWIEPILSFVFKSIWVVPLFLLSKAVNSLWFQDIADSAYRQTRGRPGQASLSKWLADSIFSIVIQSLFLLQAQLVSYVPIPIVGYILYMVHLCLLYSLYTFEYKWFNMGWEVHKRLTCVETNWPYFLGFGAPLAVLTQLPESWIVSGCIFSVLFPFFIISGNEASPIQGVCIYPLHLFSPVIAVANTIFAKTIGHKENKATKYFRKT